MMKLRALATVSALVAATAAATAFPYPHTSAQTPIDRQVNSAVIGAHDGGFDRLVYDHRDQMHTGGREVTFVVLLQAGADYRLVARCGADCVNLNLSLRDAAGRAVAGDRSGTGHPGFNVRAPHSGAYVVTLALESCRTRRCHVGAVVLGRSTPAPAA